MDPKKLTRMQAERLAARTRDEAVLQALTEHKNKHVVAKAERKLAKIREVAS